MNQIFLKLIRIYQLVFSPVLRSIGGGCRFYPSCSNYSKEAFLRFGWLKALRLTLWRIFRCNQFNPGGVDKISTPPLEKGGRGDFIIN